MQGTEQLFYERRQKQAPINGHDRRIAHRRASWRSAITERRRLASQVRRYDRDTFRIPVHLHVGGETHAGFSEDISPEGLLFSSGISLRPATNLALDFQFGEDTCRLKVKAQVLFSRLAQKPISFRQAIGIKFLSLQDFERSILVSAAKSLRNTPQLRESQLDISIVEDRPVQMRANHSAIFRKHDRIERRPKVVVTGIGVVSPVGIGIDRFWESLAGGRSGIRRISRFDPAGLSSQIAGEVIDFDPLLYMNGPSANRMDRFSQFGIAAAMMALEDSGLKLSETDLSRVAVCVGSGMGGVPFQEEQIATALERGVGRIYPLSVPKVSPNSVSSQIAIRYGLKGPALTISTACASSAHAIGQSIDMIRSGRVDVAIAGGAEASITPFTFAAYNSLSVLSTRNQSPERACRPFDKGRDGLVMGEGAGILVLESFEHAMRRGAEIHAEFAGYGATSDAYHMVVPEPDGKSIASAMRMALLDAGMTPEEVSCISAHGTSTKINDLVETKAIKEVFGQGAYRIPVSSTKSMIGHLIGAAGALQAIAAVLSIRHQIIPPTINLDEPDPECDLDYVPNVSRRTAIRSVLSNSFGFGGTNGSIIIKKAE